MYKEDDGAIKPLINKILFMNASLDRLARFRSRVCQLVGAGGEESDESVLDKLRDRISATSSDSVESAPFTPDQRAEVRKIAHEILDEVERHKLEDAGKWD